MRRIFTLAALFLISLAAKAQIRGTVQDRDLNGIAAATVTLTAQSDSNNVARTVTDSSGAYQFTGTPAGKYVLRVEALNYQEKVNVITANDTAATVADVFVDVQGKDLAGVTVIASAPPVVVKGDTSQFSASQYKVNPDATTEDLIKKMPGITVAKDGTVTAQGETVKKVTIDGKDFFGDDASAALKNLPSEIVDKIQVFDKLSDQAQLTGFDDGNSVKAINVVTKSGIKNGRFGRLYAGYGTDDRYAAGGNASFFKGNRRISIVGNFNNINQQNFGAQDLLGVTSSAGGGGGRGGTGRGGGGGGDFNVGQTAGISKTNALGINFSNQYGTKATLTGSYFFNNSKNTNQSLTNTENLLSNDTANLFQRQTGNSLTNNTNHRINLRFEYKFDSSNSLFIIPSVNIQKNNSNSSSSIFSYYGVPGDGSKLLDTSYTYDGLNSNDRTGFNIRNNILFRHSFAKKGRSLSLGFNVAFTKNDGEAINNSIYHFFDPLKDSLQNQFNDNSTNGHTIGGTIAYTEPVGKKAQIQFDYNPSVQKNTADQQTFSFDGSKYSQFDPLLSNKFDNTITTNNGGVTYRFTPSKDEQFSAGVSYQNSKLQSDRIFPSQTSVNQSFSTFLPNLMWRKKLSAKSNIRIFYRASTNFPSVNQLQDVVNLTNPLRVSSGNPLLKQSYTQFVAGRYQYTDSKTGRSFFANLFLQTASNYISNATYIPSADSTIQNGIMLQKGSQFIKPVNLDGYNSVRTFFTYSMPVKSLKTVVNLNAGYAYSRLPGLSNNVKIITNNNVYNAGVVLASNISEYVDFNLSYSANFNQTSGDASGTNNYVYQNAGAQVNLLDKKGWFLQNDVNYQANSGLGDGLNQKYALWNAAIGKKFLPNHVGELKLSVFDLLGQNQSIVRTVTENYIQDVQSVVLQRYFMLTFTYNLKNFGVAATKGGRNTNSGDQNRPQLPMGGNPGGAQGGPGF